MREKHKSVSQIFLDEEAFDALKKLVEANSLFDSLKIFFFNRKAQIHGLDIERTYVFLSKLEFHEG